jgi:hypothetical protein
MVEAPGVETAVRQPPITIDHEDGSIGIHEDPADVPDRAPKCAIVRRDVTESSEGYELSNVVETALARALVLAAEAKRWDVVSQIADELRRRGSAQTGPASALRVQQSFRK